VFYVRDGRIRSEKAIDGNERGKLGKAWERREWFESAKE